MKIKLGCAEHSGFEIGEAELFFAFGIGLVGHHPGNHFHYLWNEESQNNSGEHVEESVEDGDGPRIEGPVFRSCGIVGCDSCKQHNSIANRIEEEQAEKHSRNVEDQVGTSCSLAGSPGGHSHHLGSECGSQVLSHDKCQGYRKFNPPLTGHKKDDGCHGRRGLKYDAEYGSYHDK